MYIAFWAGRIQEYFWNREEHHWNSKSNELAMTNQIMGTQPRIYHTKSLKNRNRGRSCVTALVNEPSSILRVCNNISMLNYPGRVSSTCYVFSSAVIGKRTVLLGVYSSSFSLVLTILVGALPFSCKSLDLDDAS
eukprot:scaffold200_cov173-Amphora_coffeaeformis.AAC.5